MENKNCYIYVYSYRIAITKLDILDSFDEIKIGVAYKNKDDVKLENYPGKFIIIMCM